MKDRAVSPGHFLSGSARAGPSSALLQASGNCSDTANPCLLADHVFGVHRPDGVSAGTGLRRELAGRGTLDPSRTCWQSDPESASRCDGVSDGALEFTRRSIRLEHYSGACSLHSSWPGGSTINWRSQHFSSLPSSAWFCFQSHGTSIRALRILKPMRPATERAKHFSSTFWCIAMSVMFS